MIEKLGDAIPFPTEARLFMRDAEHLIEETRPKIETLRGMLEGATHAAADADHVADQQDAQNMTEALDAAERAYADLGASIVALQEVPRDEDWLTDARGKYAKLQAALEQMEQMEQVILSAK